MSHLFIAERVGSAYRGEVIDSKTFETVSKTARTYPNETSAKIAAQREWNDRETVKAVQA